MWNWPNQGPRSALRRSVHRAAAAPAVRDRSVRTGLLPGMTGVVGKRIRCWWSVGSPGWLCGAVSVSGGWKGIEGLDCRWEHVIELRRKNCSIRQAFSEVLMLQCGVWSVMRIWTSFGLSEYYYIFQRYLKTGVWPWGTCLRWVLSRFLSGFISSTSRCNGKLSQAMVNIYHSQLLFKREKKKEKGGKRKERKERREKREKRKEKREEDGEKMKGKRVELRESIAIGRYRGNKNWI